MQADLAAQRAQEHVQQDAIEVARRVLVAAMARSDDATRLRIVEAHAALATLAGEAPTYNFEPALLLLEIGGLLASVARTRENAA